MTAKQFILAMVATYVAFFMAFVITSPSFAEEWKVEVVGFDFEKAEVLLKDEDGYIWICPFGESDWAIGEEYTLVLSEDGNEIID